MHYFRLVCPRCGRLTYVGDGRLIARAVFLHQFSDYYGMRSFFYSLVILPLHWNLSPWPVVALQCLLAAFVLGGLSAPWIAPANPAAIDLAHRLESPSAAHWAGTDELGRDTLSRLLYGARLSLAVSVTVVAISLALGLAVGGLAGYLGGWIDIALTTFAMNTFLALPGILLAIAFAAFLGPGFSNLVLALAIGGWAGYARLVRAQVMAVRDREYVDAARALGASGMRIFFRHILPNTWGLVLVQATFGIGNFIYNETTLSLLGLGVQPPNPDLGSLVSIGALHIYINWMESIVPAAILAVLVVGFAFLGDGLRDAVDPRASE